MPISPENRKLYPGGSPTSRLWNDLRAWVALRSGWRCEGSPKFPDCRAVHGEPHPVTGSKVVLTVAHMNHDLKANGPDDLRHLCQRCHNTHDAPFRALNRKIRMDRETGQKALQLAREIEQDRDCASR